LVKIQIRNVARTREKLTRVKRYETSPSFKKTQMRALVRTQEKPKGSGNTQSNNQYSAAAKRRDKYKSAAVVC